MNEISLMHSSMIPVSPQIHVEVRRIKAPVSQTGGDLISRVLEPEDFLRGQAAKNARIRRAVVSRPHASSGIESALTSSSHDFPSLAQDSAEVSLLMMHLSDQSALVSIAHAEGRHDLWDAEADEREEANIMHFSMQSQGEDVHKEHLGFRPTVSPAVAARAEYRAVTPMMSSHLSVNALQSCILPEALRNREREGPISPRPAGKKNAHQSATLQQNMNHFVFTRRSASTPNRPVTTGSRSQQMDFLTPHRSQSPSQYTFKSVTPDAVQHFQGSAPGHAPRSSHLLL